jgi:hypothetical protein
MTVNQHHEEPIEDAVEDAEDFIQVRPLTALLIALVAGALAAKLVFR